jgi:hypothetical protein
MPRDDVEECRASNAPRPFTTAKVIVGDNPARESEAFSWAKVEELVRRWADEVKRDVDTPDLWADLERDGEILTGARFVDVDNTPFTLDEQAEIAVRLREIIEFAKTPTRCPVRRWWSLRRSSTPPKRPLVASAGKIGCFCSSASCLP